MKSRHQAIRDLLLTSEDGLTIKQIAEHFACDSNTLNNTMKTVWGVYIDRWTLPKRGQYTAVYMCAEVPPNAPHPTK
jgi:hypothetical protein